VEERRSDTDSQDPGREVSDQNAEEQPNPGGSDTDPRPEEDGEGDGAAGEGSQSTGHPDSAG
jgi:hypothetical protein